MRGFNSDRRHPFFSVSKRIAKAYRRDTQWFVRLIYLICCFWHILYKKDQSQSSKCHHNTNSPAMLSMTPRYQCPISKKVNNVTKVSNYHHQLNHVKWPYKIIKSSKSPREYHDITKSCQINSIMSNNECITRNASTYSKTMNTYDKEHK